MKKLKEFFGICKKSISTEYEPLLNSVETERSSVVKYEEPKRVKRAKDLGLDIPLDTLLEDAIEILFDEIEKLKINK